MKYIFSIFLLAVLFLSCKKEQPARIDPYSKTYFDCSYQSGAVFENVLDSLDTIRLTHVRRDERIEYYLSDGDYINPKEVIYNSYIFSNGLTMSVRLIARENSSDYASVVISSKDFRVYLDQSFYPTHNVPFYDTYNTKYKTYTSVASVVCDTNQVRFAPGVGLIEFYEKSGNKETFYILKR